MNIIAKIYDGVVKFIILIFLGLGIGVLVGGVLTTMLIFTRRHYFWAFLIFVLSLLPFWKRLRVFYRKRNWIVFAVRIIVMPFFFCALVSLIWAGMLYSYSYVSYDSMDTFFLITSSLVVAAIYAFHGIVTEIWSGSHLSNSLYDAAEGLKFLTDWDN